MMQERGTFSGERRTCEGRRAPRTDGVSRNVPHVAIALMKRRFIK
jgi:hypothetical protein